MPLKKPIADKPVSKQEELKVNVSYSISNSYSAIHARPVVKTKKTKKSKHAESVYLAKMKLDKAVTNFDFSLFDRIGNKRAKEFDLFCKLLYVLNKDEK